jgi:hypothetical protein
LAFRRGGVEELGEEEAEQGAVAVADRLEQKE